MGLIDVKERGIIVKKDFAEKEDSIKKIDFEIPYYPSGFVMPDYIRESWRLERADGNSVHKIIPRLHFDFLPGELKPGDQFNAIVMPRERKEKSRQKGGRGPHRIFQFRFSHNYIGHVIRGNNVPENYYSHYNKRLPTLPHRYIQSGLVYRFEVLTVPQFLPEDRYRDYKIFFCRPLNLAFEKSDLEHRLTHTHFHSR